MSKSDSLKPLSLRPAEPTPSRQVLEIQRSFCPSLPATLSVSLSMANKVLAELHRLIIVQMCYVCRMWHVGVGVQARELLCRGASLLVCVHVCRNMICLCFWHFVNMHISIGRGETLRNQNLKRSFIQVSKFPPSRWFLIALSSLYRSKSLNILKHANRRRKQTYLLSPLSGPRSSPQSIIWLFTKYFLNSSFLYKVFFRIERSCVIIEDELAASNPSVSRGKTS